VRPWVPTLSHVSRLDDASPVPLYEQLAGVIRGQVERGELTGRVPSVKDLAQQYEVSKGTAERALALLRDEGLIASAMGRGHFVIKRQD